MSEMVERVARALCVSEGRDPDAPSLVIPGLAMSESGSDRVWAEYIRRALAAIAAMREPTKAMVDVGKQGLRSMGGRREWRVGNSWRAMIDVALLP